MKHCRYIGSGPYCYSNSFAMMFGEDAPRPDVIEFATSSAFGMQIVGGDMPYFDPYGWTPEAGFDDALKAMGWTSDVTSGGEAEQALNRLKAALARGPVWVGPVDMGWLRHQPGRNGPIGADHYVVVLAVEDGQVWMHDPEGHPFARLPVEDFLEAWRGDALDYGEAYTMRTNFRRVRAVHEEEVILAALPAAVRWLSMRDGRHLPEGTIGNAQAAEALADRVASGCGEGLREHLIHFAVRVGARRLADAATCLERVGLVQAAAIAFDQARLVGSLQYSLTRRRDAEAAATLRCLAPTYEQLRLALLAKAAPAMLGDA